MNSRSLFVAAVTHRCGLTDKEGSEIERDNETHAANRAPLA